MRKITETRFIEYWCELNAQLALLGKPEAVFPVAIACFGATLFPADAARYIKAPYCPKEMAAPDITPTQRYLHCFKRGQCGCTTPHQCERNIATAD